MTKEIKKISQEEYEKIAVNLYGENLRDWKFRCPFCEKVMSGLDYKNAGVPVDEIGGVIGYSCLGRFLKEKNSAMFSSKDKKQKNGLYCDYTTGGLFNFSPICVIDEKGEEHWRMDFADSLLN